MHPSRLIVPSAALTDGLPSASRERVNVVRLNRRRARWGLRFGARPPPARAAAVAVAGTS